MLRPSADSEGQEGATMDEQRQTMEREWLTTVECAEHLRRSTKSIHRYIRRGLLRASQIAPGAHVLISRKSIEDMLTRRMNRPAIAAVRPQP